MIKRVFSGEELRFLPLNGVEAQKIRSLYAAYGTGYEFCRFFCQGNSFLAALDGDIVLHDGENADYEELADFLTACGFRSLFCSENAEFFLRKHIKTEFCAVNLMRFEGTPLMEKLVCYPMLEEVYFVLKTGFDIEFEPWYLDISHRIRHGISRCYMLEGCCALAVQYNTNGEALLSQVAVLPERRGEGLGTRFVRAVCGELAPSEVYVLCEDGLKGFYEKAGFVFCGRKFTAVCSS